MKGPKIYQYFGPKNTGPKEEEEIIWLPTPDNSKPTGETKQDRPTHRLPLGPIIINCETTPKKQLKTTHWPETPKIHGSPYRFQMVQRNLFGSPKCNTEDPDASEYVSVARATSPTWPHLRTLPLSPSWEQEEEASAVSVASENGDTNCVHIDRPFDQFLNGDETTCAIEEFDLACQALFYNF